MISLILRFYNPESGMLSLDGLLDCMQLTLRYDFPIKQFEFLGKNKLAAAS